MSERPAALDRLLGHIADNLPDDQDGITTPSEKIAALEQASTDRAADLIAPIEAKVRAAKAQERADYREATLRIAAHHLRTTIFRTVYEDTGQKAAEGVQRAADALLGMVGITPPEPDSSLADLTRIPVARSVRYIVRGAPEVPDEYNETRTIAPTELTLTYRATPDSHLGRVHAYVKGWWMQDGARVHAEAVGRYFTGDPTHWPAWLAAEARLHDPDSPS
ncbi:hypothetical protein [Streptomyces sp. NPDC057877]|uniref:hypothetical protein n=1 Tax=Streptomyces sp. NPDC057877 TaxID=3346269 RepID=UPI00367C6E0E